MSDHEVDLVGVVLTVGGLMVWLVTAVVVAIQRGHMVWRHNVVRMRWRMSVMSCGCGEYTMVRFSGWG